MDAAKNPLILKYGLTELRRWILENKKDLGDIDAWDELAIERLCIRGLVAGWREAFMSPEAIKGEVPGLDPASFPIPTRALPLIDYGARGPVGHFPNFVRLCWNGAFKWSENMDGEIIVNHWATRCAYDFFNRRPNTETDADYQIVAGCGSSGKTGLYSVLALVLCYCFPKGFMCKVCTTTMRGAEGRIWGQITQWHRRSWFSKAGTLKSSQGYDDGEFKILSGNEHRLLFYGTNQAAVQQNSKARNINTEKNATRGIEMVPVPRGNDGAGAVSGFIGLKAPVKLLVVDEATEVDASIFREDMHTNWRLADLWSQIVFLGNPTWESQKFVEFYKPKKGWNDTNYYKGSRGWKTERGGWVTSLYGLDTPNREWRKKEDPKRKPKEPISPFGYLLTQTDIDKAEIKAQGRDTVAFSRMVEGWLCEDAINDTILTPKAVDVNGCEGVVEWTGEGRYALMACDPAFGGDNFAVAIGYIGYGYTKGDKDRRVFLELETVKQIPYKSSDVRTADQQQVATVATYASSYGIPREMLASDSTGSSMGFVVGMEAEMKGAIYRVCFAGKPTERTVSPGDPRKSTEAYVNGNSEIIMSVREFLPYLRGLTHAEMMDQFYKRKFRVMQGNKFCVEIKHDFIKRYGHSPDEADAVAILIDLARSFGLGTDRLMLPGSVKAAGPVWANRASALRMYASSSGKPLGMMQYGAA